MTTIPNSLSFDIHFVKYEEITNRHIIEKNVLNRNLSHQKILSKKDIPILE